MTRYDRASRCAYAILGFLCPSSPESLDLPGLASPIVPVYCSTPAGDLVISAERLRSEILELIEYGDKNGMKVKVISGVPLCAFASQDELEIVNSRLVRCDGGLTWATIDPSGMLKPCPPWDMDCGHLGQTCIRDIWKSSPALREIRNQRFIPDDCRACASLLMCRAGCRVCAMAGRYAANALDPLVVGAPLRERLYASSEAFKTAG